MSLRIRKLLGVKKPAYALFGIEDLPTDRSTRLADIFAGLYLIYDQEQRYYEIPAKLLDTTLAWLDYEGVSFTGVKFPFAFQQETILRDVAFTPEVLKSNIRLYEFQKEAIDFQVKRNRIYNAYDLGLGKSLISIATFSQWFQRGDIQGVVLLVKNGLQYHWKREILHFSSVFAEDDILLIDNENKKQPFSNQHTIVIIPHHLFSDVLLSYSRRGVTQKKSSRRWTRFYDFTSWKPSVALVVDESHSIKNADAVIGKAVMHHIDCFSYRLFCSATPSINSFSDWFFQLNLLDRSILNMSSRAAGIYHARVLGSKYDPEAIREYRVERVEELKERMKLVVHQKLKRDVPEMKTKLFISPVYFQMTPSQHEIYQLILREYMEVIKKDNRRLTADQIPSRFPYLVQVIENPALLKGKVEVRSDWTKAIDKWNFSRDPRLSWLDGFLADKIESSEKVIVYDTHPLTLDLLAERYQKYCPVVIHGGRKTDAAEKQRLQDLFNDRSSEHKLALLSFATSSTGINLQYGSSTIVYWASPDDAQLYSQASARTSRINSEKDSEVRVCVIDGTYDVVRYERNRARLLLNENFLAEELDSQKLETLLRGIL